MASWDGSTEKRGNKRQFGKAVKERKENALSMSSQEFGLQETTEDDLLDQAGVDIASETGPINKPTNIMLLLLLVSICQRRNRGPEGSNYDKSFPRSVLRRSREIANH